MSTFVLDNTRFITPASDPRLLIRGCLGVSQIYWGNHAERLGTGRTAPWQIVAEQFGYGHTRVQTALAELHEQVDEQREHLAHIQAVLDDSDQVNAIPARTPPGIEPPTEPLRYIDVDDVGEELARASRAIDISLEPDRRQSNVPWERDW